MECYRVRLYDFRDVIERARFIAEMFECVCIVVFVLNWFDIFCRCM